MALKTVLFLALFALCTIGAFNAPLLGVLGYIAHNIIGPERQWWAVSLRQFDIRYSLTLAVMTAVGIAVNWNRLRPSGPLLGRQEKLMLLFLGLVWFSSMLGEKTIGWYTRIDPPEVKLTKALIFVLMFTHVVTNIKNLNRVFWVMIAATVLLGVQAYGRPRSDFIGGRLDGLGGVDFSDANFLSAFFAAMLPIIGVQFLRSAWLGKAFCLAAGVFACNGIVLTRSRGGFLAAGCAVAAVFLFVPRKYRVFVVFGLVVAAIGGYKLMDEQFLTRMSSITRAEEQRDRSAQSRLEIWAGGMRMMWANPLGVGAGNYMQSIGRYDPRNPNRDAHNTFVRCAGEIGLPGLLVLLALVANAGITLRRVSVRADGLDTQQRECVHLMVLGMWGSLAAVVGASATMTLLYVENAWWFLAMPVCASRVVDTLLLAQAESEEGNSETVASCEWAQQSPIA
jgi:putative inorganic carbon (hco3(-)) transporter